MNRVLTLLLSAVLTLQAETATINLRQAVVTTREGQIAASAMMAQWKPKETKLVRKEAALRADREKFERDSKQYHGWWLWRRTIGAKDKLRRERELDIRARALLREREDDRVVIDNEQKRIVSRIGKRLFPMMEKYAKEHGYSVVLGSGNQDGPVVVALCDITAEIVRLYEAWLAP